MKYDLYYAIDEQTPEDRLPACADLSCMNTATWVWVMEEDQVGDEPFTFKGMFVCSAHLEQMQAEAKASRDFMEATRG